MLPQKIKGDKIYLQLLKAEAYAGLFFDNVLKNKEDLSAYLSWVLDISSEEDAFVHIDSYEMQFEIENGGLFGIFEQKTKTWIGCFYIHSISLANETSSIGYFLFPEYRHRGFAKEALRIMSRTLLQFLNRIEVHTATTNESSIHLLRSAGYQEEGICREYEKINGIFTDHIRFSLLKRDLTETLF